MTEVTPHHGLFKDTNLHVDDAGGAGRPVVLIHGWPLSGKSFEEQIPALQEAGYRPITYDRRGFGLSSKPPAGYNYDVLAEDLQKVLVELDLTDVTLVGFSMGGGEVARYLGLYGPARIRSVVFASAVTPYLMRTDDNPDGPLTPEQADGMAEDLVRDETAFYDSFTRDFFSVDGVLRVSEVQRKEAGAMCGQANKNAALACMAAFGGTDFRGDLADVTVPALVIHGDGDATVPFEGSGQRTHASLANSEVHVIRDAPHGCNVSHADEWNSVVIGFLAK
ncbi:alpha/beta hydrolase fold protein [Pseudarthrobacter chlorophenolicus A6]|uniref:Alpha/beta hydrolase fold protein n=1 Tax=Pseudarthrobacter chlorophenolicus (strain ATCC 700700 / DSM 12829 / CIP 107037 / JCM 12360 / KCTC 9906 / NCIMB 13794 / A6) TaxID=452863 RepID=B8HF21_PSECP|nr:alpha/beta hydrolase [Pseudarthrobacter chlorophenolicus]ACL40989.1 alpha/beta hydrolase fold protein [Pseudarthrobacter chlorophenolicus A6]SDQ71732.1 Pimeloyl-ACP methyl ester carboxylesterase [Pseudarthrobacter chlorophenolicus]